MIFSTLHNSEFKSAAIKLLVVQILFSLCMILVVREQLGSINKKLVDQNSALVGSVLFSHPELEDEVTAYVTKSPSEEQIQKGKEVLNTYGYNKDMNISLQPNLKNISYLAQGYIAIIGIIFCISILIILIWEYGKVYEKLRNISAAAERVVEGNFDNMLAEDSEGTFAALGHSFNMMADRLKFTVGKLKEDKYFLKNIISDISHQLKTPLSSLILINELIIKDDNMTKARRDDFLYKSKKQLERMEWLIINLLKLGRLESGTINFKKEKAAISSTINRALETLYISAERKNQKVIISGDEDTFFYGDEEWTAEALTNIIKNCIEHTPEGGEIRIDIMQSAIFSSISVKDNGEGVSKEQLPHIFEKFYRGSSDVKTESIGIGLALSKNIIEAQGGNITALSEKGKGSIFTITFLKGII